MSVCRLQPLGGWDVSRTTGEAGWIIGETVYSGQEGGVVGESDYSDYNAHLCVMGGGWWSQNIQHTSHIFIRMVIVINTVIITGKRIYSLNDQLRFSLIYIYLS